MEYGEFINVVRNQMESNFSVINNDEFGDVKVEIKDVEKLQDSYTGLSFGREGENIQACMDLRLPFEMHQSGMPLDRVFDEIEKNAMAVLRRDAGFDLSFLQNYEMIKPKLMRQVVGVEGNEEMLKGMPHEIHGDLATVCWIELEHIDDSTASIAVKNEMLERLGVSKEQLFKDALEMGQKTHPPVMKTMVEILKEMGMPDLPAMPGPQIYVAIHTDVLFVECLLRKLKCRN